MKEEASRLKEAMDKLTPELLQAMMDVDGYDTKIETDIGAFTIRKTKTWTYPEAITIAEENIKVAKKTAQKEGDATFEESPSLSFRRKTV